MVEATTEELERIGEINVSSFSKPQGMFPMPREVTLAWLCGNLGVAIIYKLSRFILNGGLGSWAVANENTQCFSAICWRQFGKRHTLLDQRTQGEW